MTHRLASDILVDQLQLHGVDTVFCVPGESYLGVLDALYARRETIRLITARQEGGAAYMAEAYGKLTGQPGVCFVTRGPGASNASIGVHTAYQDSTPMLLCIGQVPRGQLGRDAFQEVDFRQMFAPLAKAVIQLDDARRLPELVNRAFHLATSGRPRPVVLVLPEDVQRDVVDVPDAQPYRSPRAAPTAADMCALRDILIHAERPLLLVGREGWTPDGIADLRVFAEAAQLPTLTTVRAQDMIDNHASHYIGYLGVGANTALLERVRAADCLVVVGSRLDGLSTAGYSLLDIPRPRQTLIHVYPDPTELGRIYQADLPILATLPEFAQAARTLPPVDGQRWAAWRTAGRQDYDAYRHIPPSPGAVNLAEVVAHTRQRLPAEAIITTGAGNYTAWVQRFFELSEPCSLLAPISGAMGYGVPAAVAAKLVHPGRPVVSFAGDGCFLMNGQELATAMRYGLNIVFIVVNNGMYGTIRMHQERHFPGRVHGTSLTNPNFADYACAFGAHGAVVERTEDFPAAFDQALRANRPALIEVRVDPDAILPTQTISQLRAAASHVMPTE